MHRYYNTEMIIDRSIDFTHYKALWQGAMIDTTSQTLGEKLAINGVVGSNYGVNLDDLAGRDYVKYIENADKNSITFINDYNTFYADSFLTFLKLTSVSRWFRCIDNLTTTPLNGVKNESWKQEEFLLVWMFKHNIKYKMLTIFNNSSESPSLPEDWFSSPI